MKLSSQFRYSTFNRSSMNTAERTIELSFSSERPVDQWFGRETLSHSPGAVDMRRLHARAPLLWNHDHNDIRGVVENARIGADRRGYATVRFARTAAGDDAMSLVMDGIVKGVSVGYRILEMEESRGEDGAKQYTATRWMPQEISLAPVPADHTVGVGRSAAEFDVPVRNLMPAITQKPVTAGIAVARSVPAQPKETPMSVTPLRPTDIVDLSARDQRRYSIQRAIAALVSNNPKARDGLEFEVSADIAKRTNRLPGGFYMPSKMLGRSAIAATGSGAALVGQEFETSDFINALRAKSRVLQLGARILPGMVGNVAIPKALTGALASWISPEGADSTENEATFAQVRMTPKTVSGYAQATAQMIASISPEMESMLLGDLARGVAQAIDLAAIAGTGANGQPLGVLGVSGVGSVALGVNGGPITLDAIEQLEEVVTNQNVDGDNLAYLTTPAIVKQMRGLLDSAARPVWQWSPDPAGRPGHAPGFLNGYSVARSNNVPAALTKGTGTGLSAVLFGNWPDLIIGEWGVIEISTNRFGPTFASGGIELRVIASVDVALRHAEAFAAITDAT